MPATPSRREFLTLGAALPFLARLPWPARSPRLPAPGQLAAEPFPLAQVRLLPGPFHDAMRVNQRFLLALDIDRLAHCFRVTAGLPSSADPYGGWERPECELRGHFVGHYLSATAQMYAQTGEAVFRERNARLVSALAACQRAHGDGYLSAFPGEFFDRLKAGTRVWAPFYTFHKILAGMVDAHQLAGNAEALRVAEGMADWTAAWVAPFDEAAMQKVLNVEHGGMKDTLLRLGRLTRDGRTLALARRFRHRKMMDPLAAGRDELTEVHGNTTIPKVLGEAHDYELSGDEEARLAAVQFWAMIAEHRAYATGGSTSDESWAGRPGDLRGTLRATTQETCTSYNMLKLTQQLFTWTADPAYAEFAERLLWNGILGTQHPVDGEKLYYTPLEAGHWKLFGTTDHAFWCCYGTGVENFSKVGEGIYFRDAHGVFVNQLIASELHVPESGLTIRQETTFPEEGGTALRLTLSRPVTLSIRVRIPSWTDGGDIVVNGEPVEAAFVPGRYAVLRRRWQNGDLIEANFIQSLHSVALPGAPELVAVLNGPIVLAGRLGTAGITPATRRAAPSAQGTEPWDEAVRAAKDPAPPPQPELRGAGPDPRAWLTPVPGRAPSHWRTAGLWVEYELAPLYSMVDERYAVYWKLTPD